MPEVSVVMSARNEEAYLHYAVDSILSQTFSDFEFIIIDDGSTDRTWNILTDYAEKDARIILIRHPQSCGIAHSLNEGIKQASGTLIARQDADDISLPERFVKQVAFLQENPEVGLLGTKRLNMDAHNVPFEATNYNLIEDDGGIRKKLHDNTCFCHGSVMIRRHLLEMVGYYDESLEVSQDYDLWLRLAEVTKLANLLEPLYLYRQHAHSTSNNKLKQQSINHAKIIERAIYRQFGSNPPSGELSHIAKAYLKASLIHYANSDLTGARDCLDRALSFDPLVFQNDETFERQITSITPTDSSEATIMFTETIFTDLLPKGRYLSSLKSRLLSRYHMAEVFSGVENKQPERVEKHLWLGIRNDPSWLLNRGVTSIILKSLFHRKYSF